MLQPPKVGHSALTFRLKDLNYRLDLPSADVRHFLCLEPVFQGIPALLQFDQVGLLTSVGDVHITGYSRCSLGALFAKEERLQTLENIP